MALSLETARYIKRTSKQPHEIVEVLEHDKEKCLGNPDHARIFGVAPTVCRCNPKRVGWTLVLAKKKKRF